MSRSQKYLTQHHLDSNNFTFFTETNLVFGTMTGEIHTEATHESGVVATNSTSVELTHIYEAQVRGGYKITVQAMLTRTENDVPFEADVLKIYFDGTEAKGRITGVMKDVKTTFANFVATEEKLSDSDC